MVVFRLVNIEQAVFVEYNKKDNTNNKQNPNKSKWVFAYPFKDRKNKKEAEANNEFVQIGIAVVTEIHKTKRKI